MVLIEKVMYTGTGSYIPEIKKENKEIRREQNKRYRQKNREILNLKKQRMYYQMSLEKKQAKIQLN